MLVSDLATVDGLTTNSGTPRVKVVGVKVATESPLLCTVVGRINTQDTTYTVRPVMWHGEVASIRWPEADTVRLTSDAARVRAALLDDAAHDDGVNMAELQKVVRTTHNVVVTQTGPGDDPAVTYCVVNRATGAWVYYNALDKEVPSGVGETDRECVMNAPEPFAVRP